MTEMVSYTGKLRKIASNQTEYATFMRNFIVDAGLEFYLEGVDSYEELVDEFRDAYYDQDHESLPILYNGSWYEVVEVRSALLDLVTEAEDGEFEFAVLADAHEPLTNTLKKLMSNYDE